ncbi:hypothetical protein N7466_009169 [Penicillium verhagenii]|uniref:uncharacterized protein n=1 Tax=Penicillium verhagenii TaxID=1562060 RepID=UPI002545965D|nr:uncharacterized protein N7466_009169 [Penicillium verhagenii]KAJ5920843.1 hypothetical protein N7466_009169 [Penicillium verhagenii]
MDYSNYAGHQSQSFMYGLPTPDQPPQQQSDDSLRDPYSLQHHQNTYNQYFPGLEGSLRIDPSSFVPQPHSPPDSFTKHSVSSNDFGHNSKMDPSSLDGDENNFGDAGLGRSSSEEKDSMTPAQSKRKAQNRAAQRAFRERKERHVKDLEDKVNSLAEASGTLQADNERLKRELAKFATENEILRVTSGSMNGGGGGGPRNSIGMEEQHTVTGPMDYSPTDFYSTLMPEGSGWGPAPGSSDTAPPASHRVMVCEVTGEKLLDAGATWDFIQKHELFKAGQVDIEGIADRLKGLAQCNGQGPAFQEGEVIRAIEASVVDQDRLI